jgi:glutamate synthase domain-containing protein 3
VNPRAAVSVKLVSTVGVGVIAAGVVKGLADVVHIAGSDGGTGASPLSSIKNAGLPWEVGLAETQAGLVANGLRDRTVLRVDGGFKTGRDVVVAALLGADEFSFGTAALLAEGCIMVRACHRDTCPTGIATQRPELRAKFTGSPEKVGADLLFVAEEGRLLLASLGLRSIEEAVGRTDLLKPRVGTDRGPERLDVSSLLAGPVGAGARRFVRQHEVQRPRSSLGDRLAEDALPVMRAGGVARPRYDIGNADRAVGARLSGELAREFGAADPPGRAEVTFRGSAGQSFGAFLGPGIEFRLVGEANDYVGKGMGGGRIVVVPPEDDAGDPVVAGNTVLYGATGGELFCRGRAGERFAVRNSGAVAVVEGTGDHTCEYMTRGTVLILGPVGRNLGAGMSGGRAFVYDPEGTLAERVNHQLVDVSVRQPDELAEVRALVERHLALTGSPMAAAVLGSWARARRAFRLVAPTAAVALPPPGDESEAEEASGKASEPATGK